MTYYVYLFSPETFTSFSASDRSVAGVRSKRNIASKILPGDKLVCYVTKLSRWVGILEVTSNSFVSDNPIFKQSNDPFTTRFKVNTTTWLSLEAGIPIHDDICWNHLSFTKDLPKKSLVWTPMVRTSLRRLKESDGVYLEKIIKQQLNIFSEYPFTAIEIKKYLKKSN